MVKSHLIGLFERWPKKNNIIKTHMVEGGLLAASQFMANKYTVHSSLQGGLFLVKFYATWLFPLSGLNLIIIVVIRANKKSINTDTVEGTFTSGL